MIILGITGTNGAGKGTVVEYLVKNGFKHFSAREFITKEVLKRNMPVNRDNTSLVGNDLRRIHNPAYVIEQLFEEATQQKSNAVIESVRTTGEAEFLKSKGVLLWAVDADRRIRFERNVLRGTELDKITFEKFCEQEDRQMNPKEKFEMNLIGVIGMADTVFKNDGTKKEFEEEIAVALKTIQE